MVFCIIYPISMVIRQKSGWVIPEKVYPFQSALICFFPSIRLDKYFIKILQAITRTWRWWIAQTWIRRSTCATGRRLQCFGVGWLRKYSGELGGGGKDNWSVKAELFRFRVWEILWFPRTRVGRSKASCYQLSQWGNLVSILYRIKFLQIFSYKLLSCY